MKFLFSITYFLEYFFQIRNKHNIVNFILLLITVSNFQLYAVNNISPVSSLSKKQDFPKILETKELSQKLFELMPQELLDVLKVLHAQKFSAYLFGGAVRDIALGVQPKDWDIDTNATDEDIARLFPYAELINPGNFALRMLSTDKTIFIDLTNRNIFPTTINAGSDCSFNRIRFDIIHKKIIDPFQGLFDLQSKIIRMPKESEFKKISGLFRILKMYFLYQSKYGGFFIEDETFLRIKNFISSYDMNTILKSPTNWIILRSMFETFSISPYNAIRLWDSLGALYKVYFPELKEMDIDDLYKITVQLEMYHRNSRLKEFLNLLPDIYSDRIKKRLSKYLFPSKRLVFLNKEMVIFIESVFISKDDKNRFLYVNPITQSRSSYFEIYA